MDLLDLKPKQSQVTLHHPITKEIILTNSNLPVILNVVGQDSIQMQKARLDWAKFVMDKKIDGKSPSVEEGFQMGIDTVCNCVTGWDENLNEFFKPLDDAGTGTYSPELVRKILSDPSFGFIREEIDTYMGNRENFFTK